MAKRQQSLDEVREKVVEPLTRQVASGTISRWAKPSLGETNFTRCIRWGK